MRLQTRYSDKRIEEILKFENFDLLSMQRHCRVRFATPIYFDLLPKSAPALVAPTAFRPQLTAGYCRRCRRRVFALSSLHSPLLSSVGRAPRALNGGRPTDSTDAEAIPHPAAAPLESTGATLIDREQRRRGTRRRHHFETLALCAAVYGARGVRLLHLSRPTGSDSSLSEGPG